ITAKDFDNNDRMDLVMSCYSKDEFGEMRPFPIHYWDEMKSVSPLFENRFSSYKEYGSLTVDEMFTPTELNGAIVLEANYLSTSYIRNNGDGTFEMIALPVETQFAPVNGIVTADINADGNLDVVLVGNDYGNEINMGQYDALTGIVLLGNGQGEFTVRSSTRSGFFVGGDAKALVTMIGSKGDLMLLASQNRGPLKVFKTKEKTGRVLRAQPLDCSVVLTYEDGRNEKVELPYGSGFLSQSARAIIIHPSVIKYTVTDVKGNTRTIDLSVVK
ncbi:MAG: VCBS repeat-containing protein, partial [Cyclobacteriaceae bacterium]|nr:VCBS repeat-containing protein [Cyclobacteriaceae bacterium]